MIAQSLAAAGLLLLAVESPGHAESGIASIYGRGGGKTANGESVDPGGMTAAHRTLRFGTYVTVMHTENGPSVTVRINERGPFIRGRVIDLTPAAARALGFSGLAPVRIRR